MEEYFKLKYDLDGYVIKADDYLYHYGKKGELASSYDQALRKKVSMMRKLKLRLICQGYTEEELRSEYTEWLATKRQTHLTKLMEYFDVRYNADGYWYRTDGIYWHDIKLEQKDNNGQYLGEQQATEAARYRKQLEIRLLSCGYSKDQLDISYLKWVQEKEQEDKENDNHGQKAHK